jgi:DNA-binding CsgD family transcriptional regulator/heat shock protein HslJ
MLATDYGWTPRQRQVLDLITRGRSNQEIADELGVSLDGAKWHMREILSKLGVATREEAAEYWRRYNGWPARLRRIPATFPLIRWLGWGACAAASVALVSATVAAVWPDSSTQWRDGLDIPAATVTPTLAPIGLNQLTEHEWRLVDLAGVVPLNYLEATLQFSEEGFGGFSGCNHFGAMATVTGNSISVGELFVNNGGCQTEEGLDQQGRYLRALGDADAFVFDGDELLVLAAGFDEPLRFAPRVGALAGIRIWPGGPPSTSSCPTNLTHVPIPEARVLAAEGTALSIDLTALPPAVTLLEDLLPAAFRCDGEPAQIHSNFRVAPGTPEVGPHGGLAGSGARRGLLRSAARRQRIGGANSRWPAGRPSYSMHRPAQRIPAAARPHTGTRMGTSSRASSPWVTIHSANASCAPSLGSTGGPSVNALAAGGGGGYHLAP